jgi:hypothetical protein
MKRNLIKIVQLAAVAAVLLASAELRARPLEAAVGGPEGAPNLTQDRTLKLIAQWATANAAGTSMTRYYKLDYDGGQNSPSCYQDAQTGATLSGGPRACKTWDYLFTILPRFGNGRNLVILVKPRTLGATYRNTANTSDAVVDLSALQGYNKVIVRASATLLNDVTDRKRVGGIIAAAGPNGDQSWTCAGGATTTTLTVSAGSLPTDLNAAGFRARFSGNTTVGLTDVSRTIHSSLAGTLTFSTVGTACAAGDTFFIEKPGVVVDRALLGAWAVAQSSSAFVGIATVSAATNNLSMGTAAGTFTLAFIHLNGAAGANFQTNFGGGTGNIVMGDTYVDEGGATLTTGGNRFIGSILFRWFPGLVLIDSSSFLLQTSRSLDYVGPGQLWIGVGGAVTFAGGVVLSACGSIGGKDNTFQPPVIMGRAQTPTLPRTRVLGNGLTLAGAVSLVACSGVVAGVDITGGSYAIRVTDVGGSWFVSDTTGTGSTAGVSLGLAFDHSFNVNTSNTTFAGGLELAGGAIAAVADLALTNVVDENGNRIQSSLGGLSKVGQATRVTNSSGGALAVGSVVRNNGTTSQVTCAQADTVAHAGNAPCVMVTAPANAAQGYMVCSGTPYVLYDGAPALAGPSAAYVSVGTACKATTTIPPVAGANQKLRVGFPFVVSGNAAYTNWHPDPVCVVADGAK